MKRSRLELLQEQMIRRLGPDRGARISQAMTEEYKLLCAEEKQLPEGMERHCHNNIFPVVSAFQALQKDGMERQEAAKLAGDAFLELMEDIAASLRRMLKIPGLYRLMPRIWKTMMPKLFSEDSGFRFRFYPTGRKQVKFDMLECPYLRICQILKCPELAPVFCATDDTCYGHMHPRLIWNRTGTLAQGAQVCDFDLYISK